MSGLRLPLDEDYSVEEPSIALTSCFVTAFLGLSSKKRLLFSAPWDHHRLRAFGQPLWVARIREKHQKIKVKRHYDKPLMSSGDGTGGLPDSSLLPDGGGFEHPCAGSSHPPLDPWHPG